MDDLVNKDAANFIAEAQQVFNKLKYTMLLNFEANCHSVKGRIKTHSSIVNKVKSKIKSGKNYSVGDIEDIIGFRIVTLTKSMIPEQVRQFIRTIQPNHLNGGISFEVKRTKFVYYTTTQNDDDFEKDISEIVNNENFDEPLEIEVKKSGYSSLHVVVYCSSPLISRVIPIELQIRSAFEDTWSEIEHSLKYKSGLLDESNNWSSDKKALCDVLMDKLYDLKTRIEGADRESGKCITHINKMSSSTNQQLLGDGIIPGILINELEKLGIKNLKDKFIEALEYRKSAKEEKNSRSTYKSAIRSLKLSISVIVNMIEIIKGEPNSNDFNEHYNMLELEIAYNNFLIGQCLRVYEGLLLSQSYLDKSVNTYIRVYKKMRDGELNKRLAVPYRISQVYFEKENYDEAIEYLDITSEWREQDCLTRNESPDHSVFVESIRFSGYVRWAKAFHLGDLINKWKKIKSGKDDVLNELNKERLELYRYAYNETIKARELRAIHYGSLGEQEDKTDFHKKRTVNNLISYAIDAYNTAKVLKVASGIQYDNSLMIEDLKFLNLFEIEDVVKLNDVSNINRLDTLVKALMFLIEKGENSVNPKLHNATYILSEAFVQKYNEAFEMPDRADFLKEKDNIINEMKGFDFVELDEDTYDTIKSALELITGEGIS